MHEAASQTAVSPIGAIQARRCLRLWLCMLASMVIAGTTACSQHAGAPAGGPSAHGAGLSPQQVAAYDAMQADLNTQAQKYQQDLADLRASYQRREAQAIGQLQETVLGSGSSSQGGGVLTGLQQQFGQQAQELQKQAVATFTAYRAELFRQDSEHLKHVQQVLGAQMRGQLSQKESQLSAQETAYQVGLVKADQEQIGRASCRERVS